MPQIMNHGGQCCGVRHYVGFGFGRFGNITTETITQDLRNAGISGRENGGRSRGKVVEAVVTDSQFRANPDLAQTLYDSGFRLVTRFYNSTGGICNILHRVSGGRDITRARRSPHVRILSQP